MNGFPDMAAAAVQTNPCFFGGVAAQLPGVFKPAQNIGGPAGGGYADEDILRLDPDFLQILDALLGPVLRILPVFLLW